MTVLPDGPVAFLIVFLIGLGLNLTPCVYPMISVTVSLFGRRKEASRRHAFVSALIFVLGMCAMYSTAGFIASLTGGIFGALLQNKWVLLSISVVFFLLALTLFGVFRLQVPAWLMSRIGDTRRAGLAGLFFSGLFVGIFAAPCIGPPVLALLTVAGTRGDPVYGFFLFFIMAMGLGLPYLILGTFSGMLHRLPRSGVWLVWMERLFGVILLSLSAFYGLLALRPESLELWIPVSLIAAGVYLGFLEKSGDEHRVFYRVKRALALIVIMAGLAFLQPVSEGRLEWQDYSPARMKAAQAEGAPVIMDFYADWCLPCHELERVTFADAGVRRRLADFVRIRVDLTSPDAKAVQDVTQEFAIYGVPSMLFLDAQGREVEGTRITGFVSPREMTRILDSPVLKALRQTSPLAVHEGT